MPPRKSNVSTTSNGAEDGAEAPPQKAAKEKDGMSVEDLSLPKSMVARLAKGVLPANTSIQKDALLALHKSATVFVNYIASTANESTQAAGKKTIMPQEIMAALKDAELEEFVPRLEQELKKYNETQCDKRNTYRRKVKEEKAAAATKDGEDAEGAPKEDSAAAAAEGADGHQVNGHAADDDEDRERPFKKFKAQDGGATAAPDGDGMDETEETIDQTLEEDEDPQDDEVEEDEDVEDEGEEGEEDEEMEEDERDDLNAEKRPRDEALDHPDSDSD